ncbi:hypothetical protein H6G04_27435 [Calothrix membranacea FACHB-236]|nr:hypothetical protein [Calothrix membranacea FACHB-236]
MPHHSDNLYCAIFCNQKRDAYGNPAGNAFPPSSKSADAIPAAIHHTALAMMN